MTAALIVSTATRWYGAARMPRALANAGFEVALYTPRGSLAEHSRFVRRITHLPDGATPRQWLQAFAQTVAAVQPALVIPGDDTAFQLLQSVVSAPPDDLNAKLRFELGQLVEASLGNPAHYAASVDKVLLPALAEQLGVRVPPHAIVATPADAESFAATVGYPVVIKNAQGWGGAGVAYAADAAGIAEAFRVLDAQPRAPMGRPTADRCVQQVIAGPSFYYAAAAWRGRLLAGWAAEKLVAHPPRTGPATVLRARPMPEIADFSGRLVAGLGISGLFGIEYLVDERDGRAYLVEINRRLTPGLHKGAALGVDLAAALHAAVTGSPAPVPARVDLEPGHESISVNFPQEWLRDPKSEWMRNYPVDAPWDDPDLFLAMLALRHE